MMCYHLHNPVSGAHVEDLLDRLSACLARAPHEASDRREALIPHLAEVVRAMDKGLISVEAARGVFARHRLPGFSFGRWLAEMVEEGVYVETALEQAA